MDFNNRKSNYIRHLFEEEKNHQIVSLSYIMCHRVTLFAYALENNRKKTKCRAIISTKKKTILRLRLKSFDIFFSFLFRRVSNWFFSIFIRFALFCVYFIWFYLQKRKLTTDAQCVAYMQYHIISISIHIVS